MCLCFPVFLVIWLKGSICICCFFFACQSVRPSICYGAPGVLRAVCCLMLFGRFRYVLIVFLGCLGDVVFFFYF